MSEFLLPQSKVGKTKLRLKIAALAAAIAVCLLFISVRFNSTEFLISVPAQQKTDRTYSRIWFDNQHALVGAIEKPGKLVVERWGANSRTWQFDIPEGAAWTVADDLSRIAWISGSTLWLRAEKERRITLPAKRTALAPAILADGSVAVAFADGVVERWDAATGQSLGSRKLELSDADQAVMDDDYLAISSASARRLLLYHFRAEKGWMLVEESPAPDPPYKLVIPAPGSTATLTAAGLRVGKEIRNSPGAVRSVVSHLDELIAAGDFDNIFVLAKDRPAYSLAQSAPGSLLAVGATQLAVSGRSGTFLLDLKTESRLTTTGRTLSYVCMALLALALLLAVGGAFLLDGFKLLFKTRTRAVVQCSAKFEKPPLELVNACASGEVALWAGAGLSAHSGFPVRNAFIATLLQTASIEGWIESSQLRKLTEVAKRGASETALNELVSRIGPNRGALIAHFTATFGRFTILSRSHELLARIPFGLAATTNYDLLLENMAQPWGAHVVTPASGRPPDSAGTSFLVKLYGDLGNPAGALLSQSEFQAAMSKSVAAQIVRWMTQSRTILFIGCSLYGLLADLAAIGAPAKIERKHFALCAVSSPQWTTQAAELKRLYGIEVIACDAEHVAASLPEFLEDLVCQVEQPQMQTATAQAR